MLWRKNTLIEMNEIGVLPEGKILLRRLEKYFFINTSAYMAERLLSVIENKVLKENNILYNILGLIENKILETHIKDRVEGEYFSTIKLLHSEIEFVRPSLSLLLCLLAKGTIKVRRDFLYTAKTAKKLMGAINFNSIKLYKTNEIKYVCEDCKTFLEPSKYINIKFSNAGYIGDLKPLFVEYTDGENYYHFGLPPSLYVQKEIAKKLVEKGDEKILRGREPKKFKILLESEKKYYDEFPVIMKMLKSTGRNITEAYFDLVGVPIGPNDYVVKPKGGILKIEKGGEACYLSSTGDYAFILALQLSNLKVHYPKTYSTEGYA